MPKTRKRIATVLIGFVILIIILMVTVTSQRISPLAWGWFSSVHAPDGVALAGYDSVAYHTVNDVVAGKAEHRTTWQDVEWRFATEYNRELFEKNPERYAPQFSGNCAHAVSQGLTKKADPQVWFVKDDKLYVFAFEEAKTAFINKIPNGVLEESHESWARRTIQ